MKISLINSFYPPYELGGVTVAVRILAEALKKRGHDVFIITTGPYEGLKSLKPRIRFENGIKVYYFYPIQPNIPYYTNKISNLSRIFFFLFNFCNKHAYFTIKNILKKEKPDIVNSHETIFLSSEFYSVARSLELFCVHMIHSISLLFVMNNLPTLDKIAGIKYPLIGYNCNLYGKISKIYRTINKFIIGSPKIVIFPSKALLEKYNEYGFFPNSKKVVFPHIFEIPKLKQTKNKNKQIFDIMYAGGTQRYKGGQTLIQAFKQIPGKILRLHIFGGGKDEKYFKDLAKGDERIKFYGQIENKKLKKVYDSMNLLVVPSLCFDNFPVVILESFISRIPVIASNIGGIPEMVKEGYNGWLFEPGNVEQLKKLIERAIKNKKKLREIGRNGYKWVKTLDYRTRIKELEEIYKGV